MFRSTPVAAVIGLTVLLSFHASASPSTEVAAAPLDASIREWELPAAGELPHDPAVGPDGALWYTAQKANRIGKLDPVSGKLTEYELPTPGSGPHGLAADRGGNIWYTGNYAALIGRLDPKSGRVTEYRMPDPRASDPHTPVFDQRGILWFTVQRGNSIGRLDPASGKITLREVPTPEATPYGIAVNHEGIPFFCEFGSNKLASIDPGTLQIREYALPSGARPRRLAIAQDDAVYYSDYARGHVGRLDPKSGQVREWASPGGPGSKPYGIAITPDGMVWYSESGVQPNTIVRFDPRRQVFARVAIPSGGGVVRNMAATSDGRLYIACSGKNKVGVVARR
jgi:virginiamycin B lyase